ncbi:hypothetical protein KI387_042631, partial [Taxus chinensis]
LRLMKPHLSSTSAMSKVLRCISLQMTLSSSCEGIMVKGLDDSSEYDPSVCVV